MARAISPCHESTWARYKAIAGERGYQTLINDTLRRAVEGANFVQDMRYAIREELADYTVTKK